MILHGNGARTLVIGLDGATFELIKPWMAAGHLPVLARLVREGAHGYLRSTIPTMSAPAWASFMTGKNPGKHGVFDFARRRAGTYELEVVRNYLPRIGTFFGYLSRMGKRLGVMNVPVTYPPEPVNGFMVSGLGAPEGGHFTYPKELRDRLIAKGYRVNNTVRYAVGQEEAFIADVFETSNRRARIALELMREGPWDCFVIVFRNTDEIMSFLWHAMDSSHPLHDPSRAHYGRAILDFHRRIDEIVGELIHAAGDHTNVVILSDHGMGPLLKDVNLNRWLLDTGFLALRQPAPLPQTYVRLLRQTGLTRENISRWIGPRRMELLRPIFPKRFYKVFPEANPTPSEVVDWSKTRAYSFGWIGQVYVNLKGREPAGIVSPGPDYEAVLTDLIAALREMQDPETGERVVDAVWRKEELYSGPYLDEAPDLNVIMKGLSYVTQWRREFAQESVFALPHHVTGVHRLDGILIAYGPQIRPGIEVQGAHIIDVAPTILHLMGLPVPEEMDGRVLVELLASDRYAQVPGVVAIERSSAGEAIDEKWTAEDEAEILRRLQDLGYLG